jgi:hypothetical protein
LEQIDYRECIRCEVTKPIEAFQKNGGKHRHVCRDCRNKHQLQRRQKRKETTITMTTLESGLDQTTYVVPNGHKQEFTVTGNDAVFAVQGIGAIKTVERLLADYQINLDQWQMLDSQIKTVSTDEKIVYNVRVNLRKKELLPIKFAPIMPVRLTVESSGRYYARFGATPEVRTCLVIPDSQNGFYRKKDGTLDPMHDPRCWDLVHQLNASIQPHTIVLLGDMLDLAEWSDKYTSSPDMAFTTQETINDLALTLGRLRHDNPCAHIVYIEGNHEKRFQSSRAWSE